MQLMDERTIIAHLAEALDVTAKREEYDRQGHLIRLDLSDLNITQVPVELGQLNNLRRLYLNGNQLTQLPVELGQLSNLRLLRLSRNQLTQLPIQLGQLSNLRLLWLDGNQLTQLPVELGQLSNLQQLYLHGNQLTQLPVELGQLSNLQLLKLDGNQLTQLPAELGQLSNLQLLYLHGNRLTQVPVELGQLSNLQQLRLDGNRLTQVPVELGQLSNLQRLYLNENPDLLTPPPEIVAKGIQETLTFLQALQHASVKRYETKLLLVGEGGTGKSSLLRALHGQAFQGDLETTHGIEVSTLLLPHPFLSTPSLVLNTWDFGGQEIYHATHQFFLTKRSLYLVVWNARTGPVQGQLDYWLDTIRVLAPSVPILLVATHIDERTPDLNVQQYRTAYPQIVDVVSISSRTGEGLETVKQKVAHYAAQLPLMGQPWPTSWVAVEQALLARPEHHIDDETYLELCRREGVQAEIAQGTLGGYLHDLGKVLYFLDDPILSSFVVLKPNWVTKTISLVLEDPGTKTANGVLTHADLERIWSVDEDGRPYARSLYPIFLRLMERFDLSYQIDPLVPGQYPTQSLIPQLLAYDEPLAVQQIWPPDPNAPGRMHVEMVYRFDFVPAGIMSWFIVRTHRYTKGLHWRDGAILEYEGHIARVELLPMLRELRIVVWGIQPYTFFVILKETLDLILARFQGLQVKREVPCICQRQTRDATPCREVYRYEEDLIRRFEHNKPTIECPSSFNDVSVVELLYGIHIVTTPQVLEHVEAGYQEILRRLRTLQQKDDLLLQQVSLLTEWNVRNFTRLWNLEMHRMEAECPNTFFLIPEHRTGFNPKQWIGHKFTLFLVCQHPPGPHMVDEEHGYTLEVPRGWWKAVAPWLKYLVAFLKFGVPLGDVLGAVIDATDFKAIENQLKLLEKIIEDLPKMVVESDPIRAVEEDHHSDQEAIGPALRVLHSFLNEVDKQHYWGGLQRVVTPDGNILWLCSNHARPYAVQPLQLS